MCQMYCTSVLQKEKKKITLKICLLKHKKEKNTLKFASCKKISFKFCVLYSTTKKHPPQNLSVIPEKERKSPSKFSGCNKKRKISFKMCLMYYKKKLNILNICQL